MATPLPAFLIDTIAALSAETTACDCLNRLDGRLWELWIDRCCAAGPDQAVAAARSPQRQAQIHVAR